MITAQIDEINGKIAAWLARLANLIDASRAGGNLAAAAACRAEIDWLRRQRGFLLTGQMERK